MGIPLPGETALIAGSVFAQKGGLSIELVIVIAASAAIVGDNIGYLIGRRYGRRLMTRPGRRQERRLRALEQGTAFFDRHGPKAVFFGRWVAALRIWAAWLAGMTNMPWHSFLLWNALGGVLWALCFGLVGYIAGEAAAHVIARAGVGLAAVLVAAAAILYVVLKRRAREA
jgi:membrane protein DedA with SNARE-associated domain